VESVPELSQPAVGAAVLLSLAMFRANVPGPARQAWCGHGDRQPGRVPWPCLARVAALV